MIDKAWKKRRRTHIEILESMIDEGNAPGRVFEGWIVMRWLLTDLWRLVSDDEYQADDWEKGKYKELVAKFIKIDLPEGLDNTNELREWFKEIGYAPKERQE